MKDVEQVIAQRYSVRAYKPDPVPDALLMRVLEAARSAPTASNRQPFRLIVVKTRGREDELRTVYHRPWLLDAPLLICICALAEEAWVRRDGCNYATVDATIAMDHLILTAAGLGLGTCWIAAFDPHALRSVLALPPEAEPVALTPLGYPADQPRPKERKALGELVRYERW